MFIQIFYGILICKSDVFNQCICIAAVIWYLFNPHLKIIIYQHHIGTGNTFFCCHTRIFFSLAEKKIKRLNLRMHTFLTIRNFSGNISKFYMIHHTVAFLVQMLCGKTVKFLKPVQMPPPSSEFTICHKFKAMGNLRRNQFSNSLIFNFSQLFQGQIAVCIFLSRLLNLPRS